MTPPRIIPVGEELPLMDGPESAPSGNGRQRHQGENQSKGKGKTAERFAVLNNFVDFTLGRLSRAEIAVWFILYRDTREGTARTAYDALARRAGCNRRTVGRVVRRLERLGLLKIVHRGGLGRGPSRYRVRPLPKKV
jgi:hypothetical protein